MKTCATNIYDTYDYCSRFNIVFRKPGISLCLSWIIWLVGSTLPWLHPFHSILHHRILASPFHFGITYLSDPLYPTIHKECVHKIACLYALAHSSDQIALSWIFCFQRGIYPVLYRIAGSGVLPRTFALLYITLLYNRICTFYLCRVILNSVKYSLERFYATGEREDGKGSVIWKETSEKSGNDYFSSQSIFCVLEALVLPSFRVVLR